MSALSSFGPRAGVIVLAAALAAAGCRTASPVDQRVIRADTLTRASSWDDAASIWSEIYRDSGGTNRRAGFESARANYEAGRPGVARTRLVQLDGQWPGDAEILELLGKAHESAGDAKAARTAYMSVLQLDPRRPYALARMGVLSGDLGVPAGPGGPAATGRAMGSIGQLHAAGAIGAVDSGSLFDLGLQAAENGRRDDAFIALDAAFESGELTQRQKVEAAAAITPDRRTIPWLQSVVRSDPLHTRALTLLGNAQLAAGYGGAAARTLEQAASSDPSDEVAMRAFAAALTYSGQSGRALEVLERLDGPSEAGEAKGAAKPPSSPQPSPR